MNMTAEVRGANVAAARLRALATTAPTVTGREMYRTWTAIMAESKQLVPVDQGELRASAYVNLPQRNGAEVTVEGGYSAPYAASVHENPRAGKTGGVSPSGHRYAHWATVGQWKFLEIPFRRLVQGLRERVQRAILAEAARVNAPAVQAATEAGFHGS